MSQVIPKMMRVRQNFPASPPLDIAATLQKEFAPLQPRLKPGARIAVGVGSRGITRLPEIVRSVLEILKSAGAQPFIIPAMGSHGGATPEGQREVLASYDITEASMSVPIQPSLEVQEVGRTEHGIPVYCSTEALQSDGIILINRIKPHTDFSGTLGSGIVKMSVIGLGKRMGASAMHNAASRLGHEQMIRAMARIVLKCAPVLCGLAILEDQHHKTAKLAVLPRENMESGEDQLFVEASRLLPTLPFDEIDLLIVDRLGKNISGAGMDPNVTGRWVNGYSSLLARENRPSPFIRRIFVRDLTPETHGNAIGIGLADVTTSRLVRKMDRPITYINALTALTPQCGKIPIYFDTDREAIERCLASLAIPDISAARIVRISSTLSVTELEISEPLREEIERQPHLKMLAAPAAYQFDAEGNMADL